MDNKATFDTMLAAFMHGLLPYHSNGVAILCLIGIGIIVGALVSFVIIRVFRESETENLVGASILVTCVCITVSVCFPVEQQIEDYLCPHNYEHKIADMDQYYTKWMRNCHTGTCELYLGNVKNTAFVTGYQNVPDGESSYDTRYIRKVSGSNVLSLVANDNHPVVNFRLLSMTKVGKTYVGFIHVNLPQDPSVEGIYQIDMNNLLARFRLVTPTPLEDGKDDISLDAIKKNFQNSVGN